MTTVNEKVQPIEPVQVNFWWDENGPVEEYTFDGDSYPYISPAPASRYTMHTTFINEPVEFFAILSPEQIIEKVEHPMVIPPPGVKVLEYTWDFGDGNVGFGPFVEHEYKFVQPGIEVLLTVTDNRQLEWSRSKPINLVPHATGFIARQLHKGV